MTSSSNYSYYDSCKTGTSGIPNINAPTGSSDYNNALGGHAQHQQRLQAEQRSVQQTFNQYQPFQPANGTQQ